MGDSSSPREPSPAQRAGPTPRQTQGGYFNGTIPASAGCWSHSGLATVSSLGQPILASLLPKNGRRNQFLRGPAGVQTPCAPEAHRRVCFKHYARVHHTAPVPLCTCAAAGIFYGRFAQKEDSQSSLVLIPRPRVSGFNNPRRTLCSFVVPKSKHFQADVKKKKQRCTSVHQ